MTSTTNGEGGSTSSATSPPPNPTAAAAADDDCPVAQLRPISTHSTASSSAAAVKRRSAKLLPLVTNQRWLTLNVGGRLFTTTLDTLCNGDPNSMLARMFDPASGLQPADRDPSGAYLIDRSPRYFEPVLNYLRTGELCYEAGCSLAGIRAEAEFYSCEELVSICAASIAAAKRAELAASASDRPMTRREVIAAIMPTSHRSELRFQGANLRGTDLSKLDLQNINLKFACLVGADLRLANLNNCCLERADLSAADMRGALMQSVRGSCAVFEGAQMEGCNFEDPHGVSACLEGANLKGACLENSNMAGVNLRVANLRRANLKNCNLRKALLAGADLEQCALSGSDLNHANLRGANLKDAELELMLTPLHMSQAIR